MKATLITKQYLQCPHCKETTDIDVDDWFEKAPSDFGLRYCNACRKGFSGMVNVDGTIDVVMSENEHVPTLSLLVLLPQPEPVYIVIERKVVREAGKEINFDEHFESNVNTSASDLLSQTVRAMYNQRECPHSLLRHVRTVSMAEALQQRGLSLERFFNSASVDLLKTFPEVQLSSKEIDTARRNVVGYSEFPMRYEADDIIDFFIENCDNQKAELDLREFVSLACFTEAELTDNLPSRIRRPYELQMLPAYKSDQGELHLASLTPNGVAIKLYPTEPEHISSDSQEKFVKRHTRFLRMVNKKILKVEMVTKPQDEETINT